jgi:hypothetical protein
MDYTKKPSTEIGKAMETKAANIAEAQKRKNDAIQIAGLQRDATILTAARIPFMQQSHRNVDHEMVEQEWEYWHNFLQAKLDNQILGF